MHYLISLQYKITRNIAKSFKNLILSNTKVAVSKIFNRGFEKVQYFPVDKYKVVYVINSKAACSSIKKGLIELLEGESFKNNHYSEIHKYSKMKGYIVTNLNKRTSEYFFFSFVRNPFKRLVSLYINKFLDSEKITMSGFFEYEKYFGGYLLTQPMSFEKFIKTVCEIPDSLSERHFSSQKYLFKQSKKYPDFVGKIEDLENDTQTLINETGIPLKLGVSNSSSNYNYYDFYTLELLELVNIRYKLDIDTFCYDDDYLDIKKYLTQKQDA